MEEDFEEYNVKFVTSLSDAGSPYSAGQWQSDFGTSDAPLVLDENSSTNGMFSLFHDSWNAFPTFALLDHTMTVRAKPWTLSSNTNSNSCDGTSNTINGWSGGSTSDFIQQLVDECGPLCEECSGTVDSDGDGIADECDDCNNMSGDVNDDMTIDVLDIVNVVNVILSGGNTGTDCELADADMDGNSTVNILDVIQIINLVLGTAREEVVNGSAYVTYSIENNDLILEFNSDIPMSGIELAFSNDFLINIENNNANLYEATALDTDIQRYVAFSMSNSSFVNNKVTLKDGALIEIEDINMIVSSEQGTQINTVWDVAEIKTFKLSGLQPNPFNPVTQIEYDVYKSGVMQLAVYNLLGQKVSVLHNGFVNQGSHMYTWDASNLSSGVYYVSLVMDGHSETMKAMLVK